MLRDSGPGGIETRTNGEAAHAAFDDKTVSSKSNIHGMLNSGGIAFINPPSPVRRPFVSTRTCFGIFLLI